MIQRFIQSKGKKYLVNCAGGDDFGVGPGFAIGQLVLKSVIDSYWYIVAASGSIGSVVPFVNQSVLTTFGTSSYFDTNWPYQLLYSNDGNTYQVYLDGTAPNAEVMVNQNMYASGTYIRNDRNAIIDTAKSYLYLQSITDGNYYAFYLSSSNGATSLVSARGSPVIVTYRITENGNYRLTEDGQFRII